MKPIRVKHVACVGENVKLIALNVGYIGVACVKKSIMPIAMGQLTLRTKYLPNLSR